MFNLPEIEIALRGQQLRVSYLSKSFTIPSIGFVLKLQAPCINFYRPEGPTSLSISPFTFLLI